MALLLRRAEQNGPRGVAEENAGLPVGPVHEAAERLGPDDQRTLRTMPVRMNWSAMVSP